MHQPYLFHRVQRELRKFSDGEVIDVSEFPNVGELENCFPIVYRLGSAPAVVAEWERMRKLVEVVEGRPWTHGGYRIQSNRAKSSTSTFCRIQTWLALVMPARAFSSRVV